MARTSKVVGDADFKTAVNQVTECQNQINDLKTEADKEIFEVDKKYQKKVKSLIDSRNLLVTKIPHFWGRTILSHNVLSMVFEPGEEEVFRYLKNFVIEENEERPDLFNIHFYFKKNPFFENRMLTKEFTEDRSSNTLIRWKPGQRFPRETVQDEIEELEQTQKGFFRWFGDVNQQSYDPVPEILKWQIWQNPLDYFPGSTS